MRSKEPGNFIPYEDLEKKLVSPVYGATDLVELGLFHNDSCVRREIHDGKLSFHKVNTKSIIFYRDEILSYWKNYRSKPYEAVNNVLKVRLTISEVDYLNRLIALACRSFNKKFTKDDLIRNMLNFMQKNGFKPENMPTIFTKP